VSGGALTVQFGTGPVTLATVVSSFASSASGQTLTINEDDGIQVLGQTLSVLTVNAGLAAAGNITTGATVSVPTLSLNSTNGDIVLSNDVTGSTSVSLVASGTISQSGGKVSGGALTVQFGTGPVTLATAVSSFTSSASGQTLTINEDDGIQVLGQTLSVLTVNAGLTAAGDITTGAAVTVPAVSLNNSAGGIVIGNDVTGSVSVSLHALDDITTSGTARIVSSAGLVSLTSDSGSVGTGTGTGQRVMTTATNLVANAPGSGQSVFIEEFDDLTIGPGTSSAGDVFNVLANGHISVTGTIDADQVVLQTGTGSDGNISVSATVTGTTSVALTTNGIGTVTVAASGTPSSPLISSPGGTIITTANEVNLLGDISAGSLGTVVIRPNSSKPIEFAGAGTAIGIDPFILDASELTNITASTLVVGDSALSGGITIVDNYDVSATSGPGQFNLTFFNAGNYNGNGKTLILGDKQLTVNVSGTVNLGNISTSAASLTFTTAGVFSIDGNIELTSAGSVLTITADGGIVRTAGTLTAGTVSLESSGGSIGTDESNRIVIDAVNLDANALGSVFVSSTGSVNLGSDPSSAGDTFDLSAGANITNTSGTGTVSATDVRLTAGGSITVNADVDGTDSVTLSAAGNITTPDAGRVVSAGGLVVLDSSAGSVGTGTAAGERAQTTAGSLVANAAGGVFIDEFDGVTLGSGLSASAAGTTFNLVASTGANGDITVLNNVTAGVAISLESGAGTQTGNILQSGGGTGKLVSTTGTVTLTADGTTGVGTSSDRVLTTATNLVANASGGSVFIAETDGINFGADSLSANAEFNVVAGGDITNEAGTGFVSARDVVLQSKTGSITVKTDITGNDSVSLQANGNITTDGAARVVSNGGLVSLTSDSASVGTGTGARVATTALNLVANASGGSVFIDELDGLNLGAGTSAAGLTFDVQAGGAITTSGSVTASHVVLNAGGGAVTASANVTGTGAGSLDVTAAGNISTAGGARFIAEAGLLSLTSLSGSIGTGTGDRVGIDALNLVAKADAFGQSVFLDELNDVNLGPGASSANATFDLRATGTITSTGTVTAANVVLTSTSGAVALGANVTGTTGLTVQAAGNIATTSGATLTFTTGPLVLSSASGSIGTSQTSRVLVDTAQLQASAPFGSVFVQATGNLLIDSSSAGVGGTFDVLAPSGSLTADSITVGAGGSLILASPTSSITMLSGMSIDGGTIQVGAGAGLSTMDLSVSSASSSAGSIILSSGTSLPSNLVVAGSLSADSVPGSGGLIRVEFIGELTVPTPTPLVIGAPADPNYISGSITANGTSGGRIELLSRNPLVINAAGTVEANGTTGTGGQILIALDPAAQGTAPLLVVNDSNNVSATNTAGDSGRIGFHSGKKQDLVLGGIGSLVAGEFVSFGNLNLTTLELGSGSAGNISVAQSSIEGAVLQNPDPGAVPLTESEIEALIAFLAPARADFTSTDIGIDEALAGRIATDVTPQANSFASSLRDMQNAQLSSQQGESNEEGGGLIHGTSLDSLDADRLTGQVIKLTQRPGTNYWRLQQGNVLFTPKSDIIVGTQEGDVHIPAGSAVFIMETGNDVAVYDLHDSRTGSIKIVAGKRLLTLAPGRQVVLTRRLDDKFEEVNPGNRIGFRKHKDVVLGEGIKAHVSEFSIPSAVATVAPIKKLLASNRPQDRKLVNQMLTNAVILSEMTAAVGPYRTAR
jgi:hypothetical protein